MKSIGTGLIALLGLSPADAVTVLSVEAQWPESPAAETVDVFARATEANGWNLIGTRRARQTFQVARDFTVEKIFLSTSHYDGSIAYTLRFLEVEAVNTGTWTAGAQVGPTLAVTPPGPGFTHSETDRILSLALAAEEEFVLPRRDDGTKGYALEISTVGDTGRVFQWRHANDGTDYHGSGRGYQDTLAMPLYRDFGLAMVGRLVPDPPPPPVSPIVTARPRGLPVLPGVTGFGLDTDGGRGGEVLVVTNLAASGPGSLAEAVAREGPRIIVFSVGGVIDLAQQSLKIEHPHLTIAGQTAPEPGITLTRGGISIATHDVILQHLKVRPGGAAALNADGFDAISTARGAWNVVIDHCSATWATDEGISASGPRFEGATPDEWRANTSHRVAITNSIIANALRFSVHVEGEHSMGTLIHDNANEILLYGNLYANNMERHPLAKGGARFAMVNNVIFNPGRTIVHYALVPGQWTGLEWQTGRMSVAGNTVIYGLDTPRGINVGLFEWGPVEVYWEDNRVESEYPPSLLVGQRLMMDEPPLWPDGLVALEAAEARDLVLEKVGAFPWDRDPIDQLVIDGVIGKTGRIIDSEDEMGGYPEYGMVYRPFDPGRWNLETLRPILTPFEEWMEGFRWRELDRAPQADPDHDGLVNLLEYALGGNPLVPDQNALPALEIAPGNPGATVRIRFERTGDPDLVYWLRTSETLDAEDFQTAWSSSGADNLAGTVSIDLGVKPDQVAALFVRLDVALGNSAGSLTTAISADPR